MKGTSMHDAVLRNQLVEISIDPRGAVRRMLNRRIGRDCMLCSHDTPLFSLVCTRDGSRLVIGGSDSLKSADRVASDGRRLQMEWLSLTADGVALPLAVRVCAELPNGDAEVIWRIEVENRTAEWTISEVAFPCVSGIRLSGGEDVLILPHQAGDRIPNPLEELRVPAQYSHSHWKYKVARPVRGHPLAYHSEHEDGLEIKYCGQASMAWLDYHDDEQGIYLASYDPASRLTGIGAVAHRTGTPHLDLYFRRYPAIPPGGEWRSHEFGVALHEGDWHWGAKRYRERISPRLPEPLVAPWFSEQHALVAHYDFKFQDGEIMHRFSEIPALARRAGSQGFNHILIAGWSMGGFDTLNPIFYPDLELGSASEFTGSVKQAVAEGGRVSFYVNSRLFNVRTPGYETAGRRWSVKNTDGEPLVESYGRESFSTMCPACGEWTDLVRGYVEWLVRDVGASGVYIDQIGALPRLCYDDGHGHDTPDCWTEGYVEMLKDIRRLCESLPEVPAILMEGCGDVFGPHVTAQLTHSGWNYYSPYVHPEVYKYTFPQFMHLDMPLPKPQPLEPAGAEDDAMDVIAREFLVGSHFWLYDHCPENAEIMAHLQRVVALREVAKRFLIGGTFGDTVGLSLSDSRIEGRLFRSGDGALAVFWNRHGIESASCTIQAGGPIWTRGRQYSLSGQERDLTLNPSRAGVQFAVAGEAISVVILEA